MNVNRYTVAISALSLQLACGQSINVNFSSDRGFAEIFDVPAGVAPRLIWNNVEDILSQPDDADRPVTGSIADIESVNRGVLTQDDGEGDSTILTGVTMTWSAWNSWSTNNGTSNGDNALMNGYLDSSGDSPNVTVTITGLPATYTGNDGGYNVIAYFGSGANSRDGSIVVTEETADGPVDKERFYFNAVSNQGGNFPEQYAITTDIDNTDGPNTSGNYAQWEGLTSPDFTITLTRESFQNVGLHGFQIVLPSLDQDGDGLADDWEEQWGLSTDPTTGADGDNGAMGDPDNDGLTNLQEFTLSLPEGDGGRNLLVDPTDADTDDDNLSDRVETATGTYVSNDDTGTNPLLPDTDDDGLDDEEEIAVPRGSTTAPFFSDPNLADTDQDSISDLNEVDSLPPSNPDNMDTDGGGILDPVELAGGTDPTDAGDDAPLSGGESIGVSFSSNRFTAPTFLTSDLAGAPAVEQGFWNSTEGGNNRQAGANGSLNLLIDPTPGGIVDEQGNLTNILVRWSSSGTWGGGNNASNNGSEFLMNGYLDAVDADGEAQVDLLNIPYENYDVYVYFGSEANNRPGGIENVATGETFFFNARSNFSDANDATVDGSFDADDYLLTTETDPTAEFPDANYCIYRNQTTETFSFRTVRRGLNMGIHGFQLVRTVPPTPSALLTVSEVDYDPDSDQIQLTWTSTPGASYSIFYSETLEDNFPAANTAATGIASGGVETSSGMIANPVPNATRLFFRIVEE